MAYFVVGTDSTDNNDIRNLAIENIHNLQVKGKAQIDVTKLKDIALGVYVDGEVTLTGNTNTTDFTRNPDGDVIIASTMSNTGNFATDSLTINQKDASDNDITFTTDANLLQTTNAVDNEGALVLTGTGASGRDRRWHQPRVR